MSSLPPQVCCTQPQQLGQGRRANGFRSNKRLRASARDDGGPLTVEQELAAVISRRNALEEYKKLMQRDDSELDVLEGAILLAKSKYPFLDAAHVFREIDELAKSVTRALGTDEPRYPMRVLNTISKCMYDEAGFRGNEANYYNPDNSMINKVLENRTGIPITLGLVYMEVAKRVGLPMTGVNIPSHFMIRPTQAEMEVLVDAFHGGEICFLEDASERLTRLWGQPVQLAPTFVRDAGALPPRRLLYRMCANLKHVYVLIKDMEMALTVNRYMQATSPNELSNFRDEGLFYLQMKRWSDARRAALQYIREYPTAPDIGLVRNILAKAESGERQERERMEGE